VKIRARQTKDSTDIIIDTGDGQTQVSSSPQLRKGPSTLGGPNSVIARDPRKGFPSQGFRGYPGPISEWPINSRTKK
jgi:hypothetical protein